MHAHIKWCIWLDAILLSSQWHAPSAAMLAHKRARYREYYDAPAQCQIAILQCGQPLLLPLKITRTIPTQHIKGIVIISGFHAPAKYLTLRHFSHFGMKKPSRHQSAYSPRLERYPPACKHSLRLNRDPIRKAMVPPVHALQLHL